MVSGFEIIVLDNKNKEINLYSDYTEHQLQALAFAAITSICIIYELGFGLKSSP